MIAYAEMDYNLGKGNVILLVLTHLSLIITLQVSEYY